MRIFNISNSFAIKYICKYYGKIKKPGIVASYRYAKKKSPQVIKNMLFSLPCRQKENSDKAKNTANGPSVTALRE